MRQNSHNVSWKKKPLSLCIQECRKGRLVNRHFIRLVKCTLHSARAGYKIGSYTVCAVLCCVVHSGISIKIKIYNLGINSNRVNNESASILYYSYSRISIKIMFGIVYCKLCASQNRKHYSVIVSGLQNVLA